MADSMRVMIETGPKGKKVVALAPDWPGLERGAKTEEAAIERLLAYVPRYAAVAKLAGMEAEFATAFETANAAESAANPGIEVVEHFAGTGSTDFWGISYGFSSFDHEAVPKEALERELKLMRACWEFFDNVRSRVSAELQKGPRGGGRDRDRLVRHTVAAELDWAKGLDIRTPLDDVLQSDEALNDYRDAYVSGILAKHSEGKLSGKWPLRYMIRHTAYHTLDHAWEMEDKDLTGKQP